MSKLEPGSYTIIQSNRIFNEVDGSGFMVNYAMLEDLRIAEGRKRIWNKHLWDIINQFAQNNSSNEEWTKTFRDMSDDQMLKCAEFAYERGHSSGFHESVNYMYDYVSFAHDIIKLEKEKEKQQ